MKNVTLDDIVFENRNKEFGAYDLRVHYAQRLTFALKVLSALVFIFCVAAFKFSKEKPKIKETKEYTLTVFDPVVVKPEKTKVEPKRASAPKTKIVQNLEPNPVKELDKPEVKPPTQEEISLNRTGPENQEGPVAEPDMLDIPAAPAGPEIVIAKPTPPVVDPDIDKIAAIAEVNPAFPGGMDELNKYLSKNMQYPRAAANSGVQGRVIVQFVVERDGSIGSPKILKGIGFGCDEEALRVIKKMPHWKPGSNNGQNVRVYYTLPINFHLDY